MATKIVRAHIFISGRVQGVGFRWWIQRQAQGLQLMGWVRNLPAQAGLDGGKVEVVAEGETEKLVRFIESIKKGPIFAKVEDVDISWEKATNEFEDFTISS